MKRDKPTIPMKPATTVEQDKPAPSMRGALVFILIALALLVAIYILSLLGSAKPPYVPPNQAGEQNWTLSPLVAQYDPMNVTPVIVINCKYIQVGSNVLNSGDDAERLFIGGYLCAATNSSTFCSKFRKTYLTVLNFPECKKGSKNVIYAFHSPSCQISSEQRNVLDAFASEFSSEVTVQYICTPRNNQDFNACSYEFSIGKYNQ